MSEDLSVVLWAQRVREVHGEVVETPLTGDGHLSRDAARSRRKHGAKAKTLDGRHALPLVAHVETDEQHDRPRTRGDCREAERPCPWAACRHHLYLDVNRAGSVKINFPDLEVWELPESCALDLAERGGIPGSGQGEGVTLEDVAAVMNLTRERVRQIESRGIAHVQRADQHGNRALAQYAEDEGFGATPTRSSLTPVESEDEDEDEDQDG